MEALRRYANSKIAAHSLVAACVLNLFMEQYGDDQSVRTFDEVDFIRRLDAVSDDTGIHAFRLLLELMHIELLNQIGNKEFHVDQRLMLSSFRSFPRSARFGLRSKKEK